MWIVGVIITVLISVIASTWVISRSIGQIEGKLSKTEKFRNNSWWVIEDETLASKAKGKEQ
jgi:hypothetical protein